eukprot:gnl/MRDRNA2_/MRDRNA2_93939_c0_seq1.p1 gnl/MRDRNA2_/MRDRNA2_93939_c0~~gnl/MRDRNA2_/MRDRNA2_93939_c0_seq1.p1  ORF type:complete len:1209 (+),score=220.43 gnl/MRDRNA2_/MRDRNA2_93939_c0_seq1:104-3730(+)
MNSRTSRDSSEYGGFDETTQQALREVRESIVDDDDLDQVVLRLRSAEGDVFKVDPKITQSSKFLRAKLNDVGREDEIELEGVSTLVLLKVIAFMRNHDDDHPLPLIQMPIKSGNLMECGLGKWHEKYMKIDSNMLLDLLAAADLMIIRSLHQLIITKFAARLYENASTAMRSPQSVPLPLKVMFLLLSEGIPYLEIRERSNALLVLSAKVTPDTDAESRTEAVRLVGKRFGDKEESVRATALSVLPKVSVQGSDDSFYAVAEWLEDPDTGIRCFAIKAFGIVADRGAERSIARVTTCLRASNPDARKEAIPILFTVCDDALAIQIIGETLEHDEEDIRQFAADLLLSLVKKHHDLVSGVIHARIQHWNSHVRSLALSTFSEICAVGDSHAISIFREMLVDPIAKVRQTVVEALGHLAQKNDPDVIASCRALFVHEDEGIRETAKGLFLTCGEAGSEAQYTLVLPLMHHENEAVRQIAGKALKGTLVRKDADAAAELSCRVEHQIHKISEAIVEALARVAEKGTEQGIGADAHDRPRMEHPGYGLFAEAANTFALVPEKGSRDAIAFLSERVTYNAEGTRAAIIEALIESSEYGHERLLRAVCILMEDQIMRVVESMAQTLTVLGDSSSDRLFEAVFHGLEHHDPRIRRAAAQQAVSMFQVSGQEACIAELLSIVKRQIFKVRMAMVDALADQLDRGSRRIISLVTERLENEDEGVRMAAIRNMSRIVSRKDDDYAVQEVCRRLENRRSEVRLDAVKALLEICTTGCERTVQAVMHRLEHKKEDIRKTATEALPLIAGIDNETTITAVCALVEHYEVFVRHTALDCLELVSTKGNQFAIKRVAQFLDHDDADIRNLGIVALTKVCEIGDVCAATEVLQRLDIKEEHIVITALHALPSVLAKDDPTAVAWVVECLGDANEEVRLAANAVLPQVASRGNVAAIAGIGGYFGHKSTRVRKLAASALFQVADFGSETAISAICVHLGHGDQEVRNLVISNLHKIAGKGNPHAFQEVTVHCENRDKRIVSSAMIALVEVSDVGDPNAVATVGGFLSHGSPDVRKAACDTFEVLTPKFSEQALELLRPLFDLKNMKVVVTALDALGRVAGRGNSAAWQIANRFLSPPHDKSTVRKAAVIAMGRICIINDDEETEKVFVGRLGDLDPEVKDTAAEWLDIYRGKKPPPSMGKKMTFRGAAAGIMATRKMSSSLTRLG